MREDLTQRWGELYWYFPRQKGLAVGSSRTRRAQSLPLGRQCARVLQTTRWFARVGRMTPAFGRAVFDR